MVPEGQGVPVPISQTLESMAHSDGEFLARAYNTGYVGEGGRRLPREVYGQRRESERALRSSRFRAAVLLLAGMARDWDDAVGADARQGVERYGFLTVQEPSGEPSGPSEDEGPELVDARDRRASGEGRGTPSEEDVS